MTRMRWLAILILGFLGATDAAGYPGLTADEARKLDPLLAVAATPFVGPDGGPRSPAAALPTSLGPMAMVSGVKLEHGIPTAPLLIRVDGGDARGIEALGIAIDAVVGEVATARNVPLTRLADLARRPEVASIQAARRLYPMNDVSVPEIGAPGVWASPYNSTGQGVIIGIVDTGIDVNHPDFQHANGTTRIKLLLDLSQSGNGPFGGTLFNESQINGGIVAPDVVGHGTHVAGTAAGGGMADSSFRGVAWNADLIIVNADRQRNGTFTENDIVNGLSFIDQQAAVLQEPYVVNLSLGGHGGAHDGTELQELAIDALVGAGKAGKAIVVAAGNERSGPPRHAQGTVQSQDLPGGIQLDFQVPNYTPQPGQQNDIVYINIWYEAFSSFAISLETPNGATVGPFSPGEGNSETGTSTPDGLVGLFNAETGTSPQNGDLQATVVVIDVPIAPAAGTWTIRIAGDTGSFDGYLAFSSMGASFAAPYATTVGFVGEPATSRNAITVGSYTSKIAWDDRDGNHHDLRLLGQPTAIPGRASPFSNAGPTRDGRLKPEICAPGELIASCYSADAPPGSAASVYTSPFPQWPNFFILQGDRYAIQQGTSQASPHVTGSVALLFQLHPNWDIFDVKRALTVTARSDLFTGVVPNDQFGNGKLNILAAVAATAAGDSLPPGDVNASGTTDIDDATLTIDFALQRASPSAGEFDRADMNADHIIDVADVVLVVAAIPGLLAPPAPPLETDGRTWILPVGLSADRTVVGAELELVTEETGVTVLPGAVRPGGEGAFARAMPGKAGPASVRIIALSLDQSGLAGHQPAVLVPFRDETTGGDAASWRIGKLRLVGAGGVPVVGKAFLGAPERLLAPSLTLRPVASNPSAAPGPIAFDLPGPDARPVTVAVYDVAGRLVEKLAEGVLEPGRHTVSWNGMGANGRQMPAGVYWVRVNAGGETAATRLTLVR